MGDLRFEPSLRTLKQATDRAAALRAMATEDVVSALAASAREGDLYLANVLATEAQNRVMRLRAVTDSMRDGVFVADAAGAPIYVNHAMERTFGASAAALLDGSAPIHVGPAEEDRYRAAVRDALTRGGASPVEYQMRRVDGAPVWTEHTITPLRDSGGRLAGYVGIVRDVSEARDARERLRRKGALLDAIFAAAHDAIVVADVDLRIVRASASFARGVSAAQEALVGARLQDVLPDPSGEGADLLREVMGTGRAFESFAEQDAEGRAWDWSAVPLHDADGRPSGVVLLFRNVTRRRDGVRRFVTAA